MHLSKCFRVVRKFIDNLNWVNYGGNGPPRVRRNAQSYNNAKNEKNSKYDRGFSVIRRNWATTHDGIGRVGLDVGSFIEFLLSKRSCGHGVENCSSINGQWLEKFKLFRSVRTAPRKLQNKQSAKMRRRLGSVCLLMNV